MAVTGNSQHYQAVPAEVSPWSLKEFQSSFQVLDRNRVLDAIAACINAPAIRRTKNAVQDNARVIEADTPAGFAVISDRLFRQIHVVSVV